MRALARIPHERPMHEHDVFGLQNISRGISVGKQKNPQRVGNACTTPSCLNMTMYPIDLPQGT